ncbi:diguanylate cyclase [Brevundimonas sp.]|uniref:GGDEF domain-containing protein n=1 Tax=Brevundimonas sp. TaxID=1871086 RepID=UPI0025FB2979|nr:diguanylate cyclase [Brevundimonas sp.]
MTADVDTTLRGPAAYDLAKNALQSMERAGVWPTPLNFELWLYYLGQPDSALAKELDRILRDGALTEEESERLATEFLPRARLSEEIRDAGAQLSRELTSVAGAIAEAQRSQAAYGETLAEADQGLEAADAPQVKQVIQTLTRATVQAREENSALEQRLAASTKEVAKLREHLEQVRRDAMTDALTNLANRKAFDDELERRCAEAAEAGEPLTLAVLDVDHFKRFNDTWGHQTGDQVLRYVASVLSRVASPPRVAARYGGEEFAVIFPGASAAGAEALMEAVRREIGSRQLKRRSTNDELGAVTISIGVAHWKPGETPACLLGRADEALYASKRGGRDRVTVAERLEQAA